MLFAPGYSVIDGTLLEHNGTFYLFHKEEEFGAKTGERRAIRLAISQHLEGPYVVQEGPLNHGQIAPVITEGPCVMPDPTRPGWLLLYDFCMTDGYGVSCSSNLRQWTIEKVATFPPEARHGSTAWLSSAEAAALRTAFRLRDEWHNDDRIEKQNRVDILRSLGLSGDGYPAWFYISSEGHPKTMLAHPPFGCAILFIVVAGA